MSTNLQRLGSQCLRDAVWAPESGSQSGPEGLNELALLVRNFSRDAITCGLAAADFVRSHSEVSAAQAAEVIMDVIVDEPGKAMAALASQLRAGERVAALMTALNSVAPHHAAELAESVWRASSPQAQAAMRDDIVLAATEVLETDALAAVLERFVLVSRPVETPPHASFPGEQQSFRSPLLDENATDDVGPDAPARRPSAAPPRRTNWALLLTLAGSAAFFMTAGLVLLAVAF